MGSNSILFYRRKSNESAFLQIHTAFSENSPYEFFKTRRVLKNSRRVLGKTRRDFLLESVRLFFWIESCALLYFCVGIIKNIGCYTFYRA